MSRLYDKYLDLKKQNNSKLYLFKSGIFYISLDEDAKRLNNDFGLKLTNLTPEIKKCGFPVSCLQKYIEMLGTKNISFELIDNSFLKIDNPKEYLTSICIQNIIHQIKSIDLDLTSPKEAFIILYNLQQIVLKEEVENATK